MPPALGTPTTIRFARNADGTVAVSLPGIPFVPPMRVSAADVDRFLEAARAAVAGAVGGRVDVTITRLPGR